MKLMLKYLKPYVIPVLLCVALLFGQAICELMLPNLMSDIVNTGVQQGGIEQGAPQVISEQGKQLLEYFMTPQQREAFEQAYMPKAEAGEQKRFPALKPADFVLKEKREEADEAYQTAGYAFLLYMQQLAQSSGANAGMDITEGGLEQFELSQLYELLPMLAAQPEGAFSQVMQQSANADGMIRQQVSAVINRLFYREAGADLNAFQQDYILRVGLKMLAVALATAAAAVAIGFIAARVSTAVSRNMRRDLFEKVSHFSGNEFDRFSTASLITRTTNDIQQVQMLIVMGIRMVLYAPILGVGGVIMALGKSPSLSWIIALAVAVLLGIILILLAVAMPKFKAMQKLVDRLNLVSRESLSGLMVIRAFGNEQYEEQRFEKANTDLTDTTRFVQRSMATMMPAMTFIMNAVSLLIVWVGAHEIAASTLQVGDMMAFIQYAMQIIMSFLMIAMMFIMVPRAMVSASRIAEVLDCTPSIADPKQPVKIGRAKGEIAFEHVSFSYQNAEEKVLSDISFVAKPGQTTAFIGSTGSGKSTLINLIPRFYDASEGRITIDGVDVREITQQELRENIGYVPQKGVLFSGDIASNLRLGKPEASEEELFESIGVAQAEDFVRGSENGVQTPIAQGGTNVSGGQRQRLSIARALVKKAPVYIFDDSFSALDFKTDAALRRALKQYTGDSTVLIVAQRISTIMNAEQIIVLDHGKMVGKGTHKELLQNCPTYREIAESQLSKEELE